MGEGMWECPLSFVLSPSSCLSFSLSLFLSLQDGQEFLKLLLSKMEGVFAQVPDKVRGRGEREWEGVGGSGRESGREGGRDR